MADLDLEIVTDIEGLDELEEAFTDGAKRAVAKFLRHVEMQAPSPLSKLPSKPRRISRVTLHRTSIGNRR